MDVNVADVYQVITICTQSSQMSSSTNVYYTKRGNKASRSAKTCTGSSLQGGRCQGLDREKEHGLCISADVSWEMRLLTQTRACLAHFPLLLQRCANTWACQNQGREAVQAGTVRLQGRRKEHWNLFSEVCVPWGNAGW